MISNHVCIWSVILYLTPGEPDSQDFRWFLSQFSTELYEILRTLYICQNNPNRPADFVKLNGVFPIFLYGKFHVMTFLYKQINPSKYLLNPGFHYMSKGRTFEILNMIFTAARILKNSLLLTWRKTSWELTQNQRKSCVPGFPGLGFIHSRWHNSQDT